MKRRQRDERWRRARARWLVRRELATRQLVLDMVERIEQVQRKAMLNLLLYGDVNGPSPQQIAEWERQRQERIDEELERERADFDRRIRFRFVQPTPLHTIIAGTGLHA